MHSSEDNRQMSIVKTGVILDNHSVTYGLQQKLLFKNCKGSDCKVLQILAHFEMESDNCNNLIGCCHDTC